MARIHLVRANPIIASRKYEAVVALPSEKYIHVNALGTVDVRVTNIGQSSS